MKSLYALSLIFFFCCFSHPSLGQKGYLEGYIELNNGEKHLGKVKDRNRDPGTTLYKKIRFKGKSTAQRKFSPKEIRSYQRGNDIFKSVWVNRQRTFLKVAISGYLSLYHDEFIDDCSPYVDYRLLLKRDGENQFTSVPKIGFRKKMKRYFKDEYAIVKALENRRYKYKDLRRLVSDYNQLH